MFHFDQAIVRWRRLMQTAGIKAPDILDELESHLREDMDRQMQAGEDLQQAFEDAARRIGAAGQLKSEFEKDNQRKIMKRILFITAGIIGILVGLGFVMPALAQYRHTGGMAGDEVALFVLGSVLTLGGVSAAFLGARRRNA